jgi:hypothetical protein
VNKRTEFLYSNFKTGKTVEDSTHKKETMYSEEQYVESLIDRDHFNKWRKCIVEEWDGEFGICESCQMEIPERCIYICDKCFCLYCIVCVEKGSAFETETNIYTFCTKGCCYEYIKQTVLSKECKKCGKKCTDFEIQIIDEAIGQVCYPCIIK